MLKAVLKSSAKRINSHRGKGIISKVYGKQIRLGDHTVKENEEDITPHLRMSQKKKMTRNEFNFEFRLLSFFGCWTDAFLCLTDAFSCVELTLFVCWTDRFWGLNRGGPFVEQRGSVLNWSLQSGITKIPWEKLRQDPFRCLLRARWAVDQQPQTNRFFRNGRLRVNRWPRSL